MLTAALGKGLTPQGGPADLDTNGKITLDEWLRYAVQELPLLAVLWQEHWNMLEHLKLQRHSIQLILRKDFVRVEC